MKLSDYARQLGITYKTAHRMWKAGQLDAYQLPTGTIIVREAQQPVTGVATYARVSSADQQADLARQADRLRDYAAAKGYTITREVREIASGVNDSRPKLAALLADPRHHRGTPGPPYPFRIQLSPSTAGTATAPDRSHQHHRYRE